MIAIKFFLLAGVVFAGVLAYRGARTAGHRALWRIGGTVVAAGAALAVLFPDTVTELAQAVGVGRGADLVLYVLVVAFMVVTIGLFRRISELESRLVALARQCAIQESSAAPVAAPPPQPPGPGPAR